ncbi:MAG TPA: right-handed parallel beta-helix repeat-containing protein, partial [Fimbriimonadaceae bacterium]|nr:right-handed parallel beta-helix repeat-containing protein [Fimbriimonadaceae bacterium]
MILTFVGALTIGRQILYVSPDGNDAWSGRRLKPNARRTDGPFHSIAAARDTLRKLPPGTAAIVEIAKGLYRIDKPIVFGPQDSGSGTADRAYYASRGAVLSGMRRITGWHRWPNGWLEAHVPADWTFSQLFVNGERRYRPRFPKTKGYYTIAGKVAPTDAAKGHGFDRFRFNPGEIEATWANPDDVEILAMHIWGMSRNRIGSIDEAQHVVTFKAPTGYDANWADLPEGGRYLVENVREALGTPGQWYLDRSRGMVTYIPKPGENAKNIDVEAPVTESLMEFRGDVKNRKWVSHIVVSGLGFEGTNWNLGPQGRNFPQAEADLPGAIRFEGARDCKLLGCDIRHTGAYAVEIGPACKIVAVAVNAMSDLGAGGVKVGEMAWQRDPDLITEHCLVDDNVIQGGGRLHPAAVGVWVGQNPFIKVQGNLIRDLYYTGISVGWSWGYQPN